MIRNACAIFRAISSWMANTSSSCRSYRSAQTESRRGLHELRGDAQAVAGAADGALEHVGGAELLADLGARHRLVAEREHSEREKISSCLIFDSSVTMSSVIPSRKYSSSFAPLWFSK